jgi:predicted transcriptional regulator
MEVLWKQGSCTAEDIRAALPDDPHDSTVRTLLRILEEKGQIRHAVRGKAFVYRSAVPRVQAERKALRSLLRRFFSGSAEALVMRLVEDEQLTTQQLEDLKKQAGDKRSNH